MEYRTTEALRPPCMITSSLDEMRPKSGTIRWQVRISVGLQIGAAVSFECPNGHSSDAEPDVLKAFPSQRL